MSDDFSVILLRNVLTDCLISQCTFVLCLPCHASLQGMRAHSQTESCRHSADGVWHGRCNLHHGPDHQSRSNSILLFHVITDLIPRSSWRPLQHLVSLPRWASATKPLLVVSAGETVIFFLGFECFKISSTHTCILIPAHLQHSLTIPTIYCTCTTSNYMQIHAPYLLCLASKCGSKSVRCRIHMGCATGSHSRRHVLAVAWESWRFDGTVTGGRLSTLKSSSAVAQRPSTTTTATKTTPSTSTPFSF